MTNPITCEEARLIVSAVLAGSVEADEARSLNQHLGACRECGSIAGELAGQDLDLREFVVRSSVEATSRLRETLRNAAREEGSVSRAPQPARRRVRRWLPKEPAAGGLPWKIGVAAGLLLAAILFFGRSPSDPPTPGEGERARKAEEAARAQEERERLEKEFAAREGKQQRLAEAQKAAHNEREREELKAGEADLARTAEEFRRKLDLAKKREEEAQAASAQPAQTPSLPWVPQEEPSPAPQDTRAAVAKVERAEHVSAVTADGKVALKGGEQLVAGQALEVGENGAAVITYPDKTRLEIGSGSEVRDFKAEGGKRLFIARGTVSAWVEKQPKGQEMVFGTTHGEARVVGTTLRLVVDPDPKTGTKLEVTEGKVQFKSALHGKTVDVPSGHYFVAAAGTTELTARPQRRDPSLIVRDSFAGMSGKRLADHRPDVGSAWREDRGLWEIRDRVLVAPPGEASASIDVGHQDADVEARLTLPLLGPNEDWLCGLLVAANLQEAELQAGIDVRFIWNQGNPTLELWEWADGKTKLDLAGLSYAQVSVLGRVRPGGNHTLRVVLKGRDVSAYVDGIKLATLKCSRDPSGTRCGIRVARYGLAGCLWREFVVRRAR